MTGNRPPDGSCDPEFASDLSLSHRRRGRFWSVSKEVSEYIRGRLDIGWSPEQMSGRMESEIGALVTHELIYQYIDEDRRSGGCLFVHLAAVKVQETQSERRQACLRAFQEKAEP